MPWSYTDSILGNPGVTHSTHCIQWVRNGSRLGYRGCTDSDTTRFDHKDLAIPGVSYLIFFYPIDLLAFDHLLFLGARSWLKVSDHWMFCLEYFCFSADSQS